MKYFPSQNELLVEMNSLPKGIARFKHSIVYINLSYVKVQGFRVEHLTIFWVEENTKRTPRKIEIFMILVLTFHAKPSTNC